MGGLEQLDPIPAPKWSNWSGRIGMGSHFALQRGCKGAEGLRANGPGPWIDEFGRPNHDRRDLEMAEANPSRLRN